MEQLRRQYREDDMPSIIPLINGVHFDISFSGFCGLRAGTAFAGRKDAFCIRTVEQNYVYLYRSTSKFDTWISSMPVGSSLNRLIVMLWTDQAAIAVFAAVFQRSTCRRALSVSLFMPVFRCKDHGAQLCTENE